MGQKAPSGVAARLAMNYNRILREYRRCVEQRTMMLAAVHAVTDANSIRASCCYDADFAAQAATFELIHTPVTPDIRSRWGHCCDSGAEPNEAADKAEVSTKRVHLLFA